MLDCNACTRRCIRAIAGDSITVSRSHPRLLLTPRLTAPSPRRRASTAVAATSSSSNGEPYLNAAQLRHAAAAHSTDVDTVDNSHSTGDRAARRALLKELEYLPDPAKLAEHVHYTLRCDNADKALALVRLASKDRKCIVSWNHIVNWHMQKGGVNDALKVYNEMKKRGQFPDSYTYILLLRGLMGQQGRNRGKEVEVPAENAVKAVSIYTSMSSPSSRVQPSVMHTNAALKVCSFAHDTDAFWGIAGKIPEFGAGAADHITYSIILSAIRHDVLHHKRDLSDAQSVAVRRRALEDGKRVWQQVVAKWRAGAVKIDEELVCAMARVLLSGDQLQDWDAVLSLVQQTMQIERLIAPIGSPERHTEHVPQPQQEDEEEEANDTEVSTELTATDQETHADFAETPMAKTFNPVHPLPRDYTKPNRPTSLAYVTPGNDTLSVLLQVCTMMHTPKTAVAYWDLLTSAPYNLKPDLQNFHAQLRLMAKNRASAKAAQLLREDLPASGVEAKAMTFRLAMSVCQRDKNNHHVLDNATAIITAMEATLADPDVRTLMPYLDLALSTDSGPKIVAALNRLDSLVHNLRSRMLYGTDSNPMSPEQHRTDKQDTARFLRTMIGGIDTLMNRGLVPREEFKHWHVRRSQLDSFVGRARGNLGGSERVGRDGDGRPWVGSFRKHRVDVGEDDTFDGDGETAQTLQTESEGGKVDRMNKGSWELMMFRRRNTARRGTAVTVAVGAGGEREGVKKPEWGAERSWRPQARQSGKQWALSRWQDGGRKDTGGGVKGWRGSEFADSPAELGV